MSTRIRFICCIEAPKFSFKIDIKNVLNNKIHLAMLDCAFCPSVYVHRYPVFQLEKYVSKCEKNTWDYQTTKSQ